MRIRFLVVAVMSGIPMLAYAGPNTITYQGRVLAPGGSPVADGPYSMRFRLYDDLTAGVIRWEEIDSAVQVTGGLFSTTLGDGTAFWTLLENYADLWLEVAIDLDRSSMFDADELYAPRQKLGGAAWAVDADTLDDRHSHEFWRITGNPWTNPAAHFVGTTDDTALEFRVNDARALRLEPNADSPNVISGYSGNSVSSGVVGATIGGGGAQDRPNRLT